MSTSVQEFRRHVEKEIGRLNSTNYSVAQTAKQRHEVARRLVEQMESLGVMFNPHADGTSGWSISGPRGVYGQHDKELTEYAGEITTVLRERMDYLNSLYVHAPQHQHAKLS